MKLIFNSKITRFFILITLLSNYACNSNGKVNKELREKKMIEGGTLNVALSDYPISYYPPSAIDVNSADIVSQVYDGLVKFSTKDLTIKPNIAKSWEIDSSGTVYTFHLNKRISFHPCATDAKSRALTATDVAFSIKNLCRFHSENLSFETTFKDLLVGATDFYNKSKSNTDIFNEKIEGINVIDEATLSLTIAYPNVNFLNILAMPNASIISEKCFNINDINSAVGSGGFMIDHNSSRKSKIVLLKNNQYAFSDSNNISKPYLDKVIYTVFNKKSNELNEYKNGALDIIWGFPKKFRDPYVQENIAAIKNDSLHRLVSQSELSTDFILFNTNQPVFSDIRIRKAFNYAIDKNKIISDIIKEQSLTTGDYGIIPPSMPGYDVSQIKGYDFNIEKAKNLLAQAGYKDGNNFPEFLIEFNNDGYYNVQLAIEIQKQLQRKLGIKKINIEAKPLNDVLKSKRKGNSGMYINSWIADYPSEISFLQLFYGNEKTGKESYPNTSRYYNGLFNELYNEALRCKDPKEQRIMCLKAEQVLVNDAPFIPLFYNEKFILYRSNIQNFNTNPLRVKDFSEVYFVK